MPLSDLLPIRAGTALWRTLRRLPPDYKLGKTNHQLDETLRRGDLHKLIAASAEQDDEMFASLDRIERARSLEGAEGVTLDLRLNVLGLERLEGEADEWARERARLWKFVQSSAGAMRDVKRAVAWFAGIENEDADWEATVFPFVKVEKDSLPVWLDLDTAAPIADEAQEQAITVIFPWSVFDRWADNSWQITHDGQGDEVWKIVNDEDDVPHGDHLLIDIRDLVQALVGTEWKVIMYGYGTLISAGESGQVWTSVDAANHRTTGPAEDAGGSLPYDHERHPNGPFVESRRQRVPAIRGRIPDNQDLEEWDERVGRRGFRSGVRPPGVVNLWP